MRKAFGETISLVTLTATAVWLFVGLPLIYAGPGTHGSFFEWLIKFATDIKITDVLLATFTGFLVLYTARLWTATRALSEAERPHLVPSLFKLENIRSNPDEAGQIKVLFTYRMENHGKSPAFIKKSCVMSWVGDLEEELSPLPAYGNYQLTNRIIPPKGWYGTGVPSTIKLSAETVANLISGQKRVINYGYIDYEDFAHNKFQIRFAYAYEFGPEDVSTMYIPVGPDSYWEYT